MRFEAQPTFVALAQKSEKMLKFAYLNLALLVNPHSVNEKRHLEI